MASQLEDTAKYMIHCLSMDVKKEILQKIDSYTYEDFGKLLAIIRLIDIADGGDKEKKERFARLLEAESSWGKASEIEVLENKQDAV